MLVSFSYSDNIIFLFNLCKYLRVCGLKVVNITEFYYLSLSFEIEPRLQSPDNERFHFRSAVTSSEARLDIKAAGFWARGVTAFFDVRVTHVNSKCYQHRKCSRSKKKRRSASTSSGC